jgi:hypothetical protein
MNVDILSDSLLFPVAILTWRWSKFVSCSIQLALVASVAVRFGIEQARIVSVLTGLAGAVELGAALEFPTDADSTMRRAKVGSLLLASMATDGASWLLFKATGDWCLPSVQIPVLLVIGWICLKGDPK